MIRHTILFKAKSGASNDEIDYALAGMRDLGSQLPGIFAINTGECYFHDDKSREFFASNMAQGFTHAISIDFTDQQALDVFFSDPLTHPAKNAIINIAENGYDGIVGLDLENREI